MPYDPVVEPTAVSSLHAFRLLDVRGQTAFTYGHARNAVRVPIEVWESAAKAGETSFTNIAYWERAIGELGVDSDVPAVVYDDGRMTEAARVWFILQYFGVKALILNGGWPAMSGSQLKPAAELHDLLAQAGFQPGDHLVTHCDGGGRAGYDDVRAYYLSFADWAKDESCAIGRD
jgi:thiosulfate/3-mercaptopyruvate sulfurtransferase